MSINLKKIAVKGKNPLVAKAIANMMKKGKNMTQAHHAATSAPNPGRDPKNPKGK